MKLVKKQISLSDEEREKQISMYAERLRAFYYGGDLDLANQARLKMEALIKGRSKKQIRKMEIERGLV